MQYKNVNCPSCGAKCDVDRFAAMAACDYCGGAFYLQDEAILAMGRKAILAEGETTLRVGDTGTFRGRAYAVMGRIRYRYERGLWDEWFCRFEDGDEMWISEDEGELTLEEEVDDVSDLPPADGLRAGMPLTLDGTAVSVDEIGTATLEGIEGSLPKAEKQEAEFPYAEASAGDDAFTIEYGAGGPEVYRGVFVTVDDLGLDVTFEDDGEGGFADA